MRQIYAIIGMHCAACVSKVQQALQALVPMVRVSLHSPQAVVEGWLNAPSQNSFPQS